MIYSDLLRNQKPALFEWWTFISRFVYAFVISDISILRYFKELFLLLTAFWSLFELLIKLYRPYIHLIKIISKSIFLIKNHTRLYKVSWTRARCSRFEEACFSRLPRSFLLRARLTSRMESALFHGRLPRRTSEPTGGEDRGVRPSRDWIDTLMNEKDLRPVSIVAKGKVTKKKGRCARRKSSAPREAIMSSAVARNCLRFESVSIESELERTGQKSLRE